MYVGHSKKITSERLRKGKTRVPGIIRPACSIKREYCMLNKQETLSKVALDRSCSTFDPVARVLWFQNQVWISSQLPASELHVSCYAVRDKFRHCALKLDILYQGFQKVEAVGNLSQFQ